MNSFEAVMIAEGETVATSETYVEAWQLLIDTGMCWQLQGWFGREATRLIKENICHGPPERANVDYT